MIFPYHIDYYYYPYQITKSFLYRKFKENITHEFVHSIDPKYTGPYDAATKQEKLYKTDVSGKKRISDYDYLTFPTEFDAFCKQITISISDFISSNPNNKNKVLEWMRGPLNYVPSFLEEYKKHLDIWSEHDKKSKVKYINILRQRIYDEVFNVSV